MRVISGKARGKKLLAQKGLDTRPTLDRVKESLFDIIQFKVADSKVLDLFAGSGALGIEALSREAKFATFCDNNLQAIKAINKNLESTKLLNKANVLREDFKSALKQLQKQKFDIIFLDPPYKTDFALKALKSINKYNLLTKDGIVIIETNDANQEEEILKIDGIEIFDERKYGKVILIFVRKE